MEQIDLTSTLATSATAASALCTSVTTQSPVTTVQILPSAHSCAVTLASPIDLESLT